MTCRAEYEKLSERWGEVRETEKEKERAKTRFRQGFLESPAPPFAGGSSFSAEH